MKSLPLALVLSAALCGLSRLHAVEPPLTGAAAEKRFPPLKLPPGFKATLFASDLLIEYPSVISIGPRPGTVLVAHDYMTGLGMDIVRRDEVRLVEDSDGDGYADKSTVFAGGLNSIQGLALQGGAVYVMHAPFLTVFRDLDGDGVSDQRQDLLTGIGLPPEDNPQRLHCANGVVPGHDGWLYLAVGDHGCDIPRPEGDRLVLHGGGILRCRPDGRDLHVFATGLRNIYDVALDEELNVFVRDNENDGGSYKVRVCHSFFGADHGYPYKYTERPAEALPPLADMGLGSSAGGVCYLEPAFPAEYRGNLFFCEWGHSVVHYGRQRAGGSFAPMQEIEFAAGAENDPYGFKPTDLVVDRDGSLLVSDWADGQRPKRGRGRIYRISYEGQASSPAKESGEKTLGDWIAQVDAPSLHRRNEAQAAIERRGPGALPVLRQAMSSGKLGVLGRLHAIWILTKVDGLGCRDDLFALAAKDADVRVRAQAVRALADLCDPVLVQHQLAAAPADSAQSARIAALGESASEQVLLEVILALGRTQWPQTPEWLRKNLRQPDAALAHAAMQALRRSNNWPAVLALLDQPASDPLRSIALRALAEQADSAIVAGLRQRLQTEPDPRRRTEYADVLTRIHRLPGPWVYWSYRPGPRPANTVSWEQTAAIEQVLDGVLADADRGVRTATLRRMQHEQIPVRLETLDRWLQSERDGETVATIIGSLRDQPAESVRGLLASVIRERTHRLDNRLAGLEIFQRGLSAPFEGKLLDLAGQLDDGPVLAEALRQLGARPLVSSLPLLRSKLGASSAEVRAAALESIAALQDRSAAQPVTRLLKDPAARVRQAAATAAGRLAIAEATEPLLLLAKDPDPLVRRECLDALRRLREPRVLPLALAALQDSPSQRIALDCLADFGGPAHLEAVTRVASRNPSVEILQAAVRALTAWREKEPAGSPHRAPLDEAVDGVQGRSGLLLRWKMIGPVSVEDAARAVEAMSHPAALSPGSFPAPASMQTRFTTGAETRVELGSPAAGAPNAVWLGLAEVSVAEAAEVQFLSSGSGNFRVWLNGCSLYQRAKPGVFRPDSDRFDAQLHRGQNFLAVQVPAEDGARFHLRFRRKSSNTDHERLTQLALTRPGDAARGREVFLNAEKSLCLKCHRLGDQGARIGPELTGVGSRFSRIYLIESILQPSLTIAPEFENNLVELKDGDPLLGVRVGETRDTLILGDLQGQHEIPKARIAKLQPLTVSLMPEGLEKMLTEKEFIDLVTFLLEQK